MSKPLVDANILIYGIDKDPKFFDQSQNILDHSDYQLVTTSKNLVEFITVITRASGYDFKTNRTLNILYEIIQGYKLFTPVKIH